MTALSMIDTASRTRAVASFDFSSTADRAFFTAVRNVAIAARLRALWRRGMRQRGAEAVHELRFGRLEIDKGGRTVRLDGEDRPLTGYQFTLLLTLAERAGRVLTRDALMDLMKGEKLEAFDRSVDVHISRIRAAIEDDPKKPRRILTVRGAGYVFAKDQDR